SDHGLNVLLKNLSKLAGSVFSIRQPFWILPVPHQRMSANLHVVPSRKIHNLVCLREIERRPLRMHHLPLKRILRFHHVELARQRRRIGRLRELRRPHCSADEQSTSPRSLAQRWLWYRSPKSHAKGCGSQNRYQRSPCHEVTPVSSCSMAHFAGG